MNRASAYKVLGLNDQMDQEEIADEIEQKVFEIKQKILQPPQLPKVLEVQKDRLNRIHEAENVIFDQNKSLATTQKEEYFQGNQLLANYQKYDAVNRSTLLQISNSRETNELSLVLEEFIQIQKQWYSFIYEWSEQYPELTNFEGTIPLAKAQEPVSLFKSIKALDEKYEGHLPENYKSIDVLQPLIEECKRIIKYCKTYES